MTKLLKKTGVKIDTHGWIYHGQINIWLPYIGNTNYNNTIVLQWRVNKIVFILLYSYSSRIYQQFESTE